MKGLAKEYRTNEPTNHRTNEPTNHRTNEPPNQHLANFVKKVYLKVYEKNVVQKVDNI